MTSRDEYSLCVVEKNTDDWLEFHRIRRTALFRQSEADYDVAFQDAFMPAPAARANLLLKFNGKAVGLLSLDDFGDGKAAIRAVTVDTTSKSVGHGRQLVERTAELARAQGVRQLCVNASPASSGFYRKLHFKEETWSKREFDECTNDGNTIQQLTRLLP